MAKKLPPVEEEAVEVPETAPRPQRKPKGKVPIPGASKPAWKKIADSMVKRQ